MNVLEAVQLKQQDDINTELHNAFDSARMMILFQRKRKFKK